MNSTRNILRRTFSRCVRIAPRFRGLGRVVQLVDGLLTDGNNEFSYLATAVVNGFGPVLLDLRTFDQRHAYYFGGYESDAVDISKSLYNRGSFYDVGASIGIYSVSFAHAAAKLDHYVRAIEPVPANQERLHTQLTLSAISDRVTVHPVAVSDLEGRLRMSLCADRRPGNARVEAHGHYEVCVTTLDKIWRHHGCEDVGFVKIDAEGFDAKIICGAKELIRKCRPVILAEFSRHCMRKARIDMRPCWEMLVNEFQYVPRRIVGKELIPIKEPEDFEDLVFCWSGESRQMVPHVGS